MEEMHSAAITSGDPVKMFESSNQLLVNKSAMKYTTASAMLRCGAALAAAKQDAAGSALHLAHVQQAELPTLYVVLPIFDEVLAYSKTHGIPWPFASTDLKTLLGEFVRVFNATGDSHVDIKHTILQFESVVLGG